MSESKELSKEKIIIAKIINNNIISSIDADGEEMIVMGRGIGFGRKAGHIADHDRIEKIFKLDNQDSLERFKELLEALPLEYIRVSNEIISYAREILEIELNQNVYITLTDHIGFAIDRHKKGMIFSNALHEEVKLFYPSEYAVGVHALHLIEDGTGIRLEEDEAASIALHLVNAEFNTSISHTFTMTKMIREMMEIIENNMALASWKVLQRDQLIIHLKHLGARLLSSASGGGYRDEVLFNFIKNHYADEYCLIDEVNRYIVKHYGCSMNEEEQMDLAIIIKRIRHLGRQPAID